jgi:hypothetical protein
MTRLEMAVDSHLARHPAFGPRMDLTLMTKAERLRTGGRSSVIFASPLRPGHGIVPVLDIGADQIKDARQRRYKEIANIVFRIDP